MEIFEAAGLPSGVINLIYTDGPETGAVVFEHPDFAGLHFTGSTKVFQSLWATIGNNLGKYKSFPRIVGETGGERFCSGASFCQYTRGDYGFEQRCF